MAGSGADEVPAEVCYPVYTEVRDAAEMLGVTDPAVIAQLSEEAVADLTASFADLIADTAEKVRLTVAGGLTAGPGSGDVIRASPRPLPPSFFGQETAAPEAKPLRTYDKEVARTVEASGDINLLLAVLLTRAAAKIDEVGRDRPAVLDELKSGLIDGQSFKFEYADYFSATNESLTARGIEISGVWRNDNPERIYGVAHAPELFSFRDRMIVLHDLAQYFSHSRQTVGAKAASPVTLEMMARTGGVSEDGVRNRSLSEADYSARAFHEVNGKIHVQVFENDPLTLLARERNFPIRNAPSSATTRLAAFVDFVGGTELELSAAAWGMFAFWRLHYDVAHNSSDTLHGVMDATSNFGLPYSLNDQYATLSLITIGAAIDRAKNTAARIRSDLDAMGITENSPDPETVQLFDLAAWTELLDQEPFKSDIPRYSADYSGDIADVRDITDAIRLMEDAWRHFSEKSGTQGSQRHRAAPPKEQGTDPDSDHAWEPGAGLNPQEVEDLLASVRSSLGRSRPDMTVSREQIVVRYEELVRTGRFTAAMGIRPRAEHVAGSLANNGRLVTMSGQGRQDPEAPVGDAGPSHMQARHGPAMGPALPPGLAPRRPLEQDDRYAVLPPAMSRYLKRVPPLDRGERYRAHQAGDLERAQRALEADDAETLVLTLDSISRNSQVKIVGDNLDAHLISRLMTQKLRQKYPELDAFMSRASSDLRHDSNIRYQDWPHSARSVGGTQIDVYYEPTQPARVLSNAIGSIEQAVSRVQAADFQVPNFRLYLPKYTRSLEIDLATDRAGHQELHIETVPDEEFNHDALSIYPAAMILSSWLFRTLDITRTTDVDGPSGVPLLYEEAQVAVLVHELGHLIHYYKNARTVTDLWNTELTDPATERDFQAVSQYAAHREAPLEFVAEYFTGLVFGRTFANQGLSERLRAVYLDLGGPVPQGKGSYFPVLPLNDQKLAYLTARVNAILRRQNTPEVTKEEVAIAHDELGIYERRLVPSERVTPILRRLRETHAGPVASGLRGGTSARASTSGPDVRRVAAGPKTAVNLELSLPNGRTRVVRFELDKAALQIDEVARQAAQDLARKIAYAFQQPHGDDTTARKNIAFLVRLPIGNGPEIERVVASAASNAAKQLQQSVSLQVGEQEPIPLCK